MEGMAIYRRTQYTNTAVMVPLYYGWLVVVLVVGFGDLPTLLPVLVVPALLVSVLFFGFRSLMVSVTPAEVDLAYSFGWPRKTIQRARIVSAEPLRIPWWYGAGIRGTPKGWMWSIWGLDTVLLNLSDGRGFLIGTDDPESLVAAFR